MTEENKTPETNELVGKKSSFEEPKGKRKREKDDEKEEKEEKKILTLRLWSKILRQQTELNSVSVVSKLKEKGFIDFELEEGEELTEELAEEILEEGFEVKINEKIDELFKDLPDNVRELISSF